MSDPLDDNLPYITLMPCMPQFDSPMQRVLVCIMQWDKTMDGYTMKKCSQPMSERGGRVLAASWSQATKYEVL